MSAVSYEVRRGAFGVVPESAGPPLTRDEVAQLDEGTRVVIIWSGGNGPHEYTITIDTLGERCAWSRPQRWGPNDPMRYCNPIEFVGDRRYHTRVWRVTS